MISTALTGKDRGRIPARRVFYRIDENGKPKKCVSAPALQCLLSMWGVRESDPRIRNRKGKLLRDVDQFELADLYERAKSVYRSRVAEIHPDRGGDTELAVALNCAWGNTEQLFRKRGLEI